MRQLPQILRDALVNSMRLSGMTLPEQAVSKKWLRYYLDFCSKYKHPPRDRDSLGSFLLKLASKGQAEGAQREATRSIEIYYELMREWKDSQSEEGVSGQQASWEDCYMRLKEEIRLRQYSNKTLQSYRNWVSRFEKFLKTKLPSNVDSEDARKFLTHLAVNEKVAASTQNQAFNALLFLYKNILRKEYELKDKVVRARQKKHIPVVLSREEVDEIISRLRSPYKLAVQLLYGCGLRQAECLNIRIQHINFSAGMITVRDGKGGKDRTVPLPVALRANLKEQIESLRELHQRDMEKGFSGVFMPNALGRKLRNAAKEFMWQWLFPAKTLTFVPEDGENRRYHMYDSELAKALRGAVKRSGITKRVSCHTFRHSFASHLLCANYDIRTIQQLLGHSDLQTTMIYTHTVRSRTLKEVDSPLDFPPERLQMISDFVMDS